MVDLEPLTVEDDGTVPGLVDALDFVAKKYPYLVDDGGTDDGDTGDDTQDVSELLPSGRSTNRRKQDPTMPDDEALRRKFPALSTHWR